MPLPDHDDDVVELIPGSTYRVLSATTGDEALLTTGLFLGYTGVGNDDAMAFELDDNHGDDAGRVRVLPVGAIFAIDVLEEAEEVPDEGEEALGPSYG